MVTKIEVIKKRPLKIEFAEKQSQILRDRRKISKGLVWLLVILFIVSILEMIILLR